MGELVSFLSCRQCGKPGKLVELAIDGEVLVKAPLCAKCYTKSVEEHSSLLRIREVMRREGISDEVANDVMEVLVRLIADEEPPPPAG